MSEPTRTSVIEEADMQKRLEYLSIELSFALHNLEVATREKKRLWNALDQLLNTAAVITPPDQIEDCFVDLQILKPHYDEAYKALTTTQYGNTKHNCRTNNRGHNGQGKIETA